MSLTTKDVLENRPYKTSFLSVQEREKEVQRVLFYLYDQSYISAAIDSTIHSYPENGKSDTLFAFINIGKPYQWLSLKGGNMDNMILQEVGFRGNTYFNKPFSYKNFIALQEKIIAYYENNGYPFVSVQLDSVRIKDETVSAVLNLKKNNFIKLDSVINRGNAKIAPAYLQNYLGIKSSSIYNEALISNIGIRMKQLSFLKERIPYRVLFQENTAKVELFLEKKPASRFDGIIGLLPNNQTGKFLLTGDVLLKLNNSFSRGEILEMNWRRLQAATQDLKTKFVFPFLFRTPFGVDLNFKLYKKDSTFLEVNPNIGIQYQLIGGDYFKAFFNQRTTTLINSNIQQNTALLPAYSGVSTTLYGMGIKSEKLDYNINPRKGFSFIMTASVGNRAIKKNDKLNENIYKDIPLKSIQYMSDVEAQLFIPIKNKSTFKLGNRSAWIQNTTLFLNDLYRIGGLKTLRGFDEESILASRYTIFTLEYRFLFEENSHLLFFSDLAYFENNSIAFVGDRYDAPYSLGAGISFQTKAGIFSMNYALGSQYNNGIDLRIGKVHFGIVNNF